MLTYHPKPYCFKAHTLSVSPKPTSSTVVPSDKIRLPAGTTNSNSAVGSPVPTPPVPRSLTSVLAPQDVGEKSVSLANAAKLTLEG